MSPVDTAAEALRDLLRTADDVCGPTVAPCVRDALRAHLARRPALDVPALRRAVDTPHHVREVAAPAGVEHVPIPEPLP